MATSGAAHTALARTTGHLPSDAQGRPGGAAGVPAAGIAALDVTEVLRILACSDSGLTGAEAARRLAQLGPNALRDHRARAWPVLVRQLRSALLLLLLTTAAVSFVLGEHSDAIIITAILLASVGLGFINEYRAERASEALHSQVRHNVVVVRDGKPCQLDVTGLVPGDLVHLTLGAVVPADIRLIRTTNLECDEAVLTGESLPASKSAEPVAAGLAIGELRSMAFMGTVVHAGSAVGMVVRTGVDTEFGRIATALGQRQPETDFQAGLRHFSMLLLQVALTLTSLIFITNLVLHRSLLDSLLFSLAIAVGITPQLLPAVVSTSLAAGSRQLARRKVLVKRLVCIEDLGDMDVLVTDKTGTLTEGAISFEASLDPDGRPDDRPALLGLLAADVDASAGRAVGGNPLDLALWRAVDAGALDGYHRVGELPFDHSRQLSSVVVDPPDGQRQLVTKGAPEAVLARCGQLPAMAQSVLDELFAAGSRVIAVASRPAIDLTQPGPADEQQLTLTGYLVFLDPLKAGAARSLKRLAALGITVKVATGDNPQVARKLCADLGLPVDRILTGPELDGLDDAELVTVAQ
ncbi:MAG TPA: HAD-IC family P-type ATPase, partial [Jatrophihabitans sp.]|nr:HAD-IC family P-type ATPase [Jatrophihabitans sp.]